MNQLPALMVALPLLSAPLCIILRRPVLARAFATVVCWTAFTMAASLLSEVEANGNIAYHIGGWEPPWGIELRVDSLTVLLLLVVTGVGSAVVLGGIGPRSYSLPEGQEAYFYAAYLLCMTGLIGMTVTGDAFNVFVFLEISSLSTYTLIALGNTRRALTAALSYLMVGTVGGTFILLGIGMLYQLTGSLNMADIAARLPPVVDSRTLPVAFAFLTVGLGLKVAVFPLHQWLPNAYAYAPSAVSAFVAGTATKVIYYLLLRFSFVVIGAGIVFGRLRLGELLMPLSLLAMFAGSTAAIFQKDLKRLLAYSSIGQLGYMTLAASFGTALGLQAGLIHIVAHALTKSAMFMAVGALVAHAGSASFDKLAGAGKQLPLTVAALVAGGLSLIGVPGTSGFVSKWYLVLAALEAGQIGVAVAILCSSLLAVAYIWRVIEVAYFREPPSEVSPAPERPGLLLPAWGLTLASLFFGIFTTGPVALAERAANELLDGGKVSTVLGVRPAQAHGQSTSDESTTHEEGGGAHSPAPRLEHEPGGAKTEEHP